MRVMLAGALLLPIATAGCTVAPLTPGQARVYDEVAACRSEGWNVQAVDVQADGRFMLRGQHTDIQLLRRCLSERFGYNLWNDPRIVEQPLGKGGG